MKCQRCKEREANVKIMKQQSGKAPQMLMLCDECARELGIAMPGNILNGGLFGGNLGAAMAPGFGGIGNLTSPLDILASAFEAPFGLGLEGAEDPGDTVSCPTCGITRGQFTKSGFLGCPDCYEVFAKWIDPMFLRTQMGSKHVGRKPGISGNIDVPADQEKEAPIIKQVTTQADQLENLSAEEKAKRMLILDKEHQLKQAVKEEDYAKAAKLRDEIQALKDEEGKK